MINKHAENAFVIVGDETPEQVEEYSYVGQLDSVDPNHEKKVRCRMIHTRQAVQNNKKQATSIA